MRRSWYLLFLVVLSFLACAKIDRLATVNTVTNESSLKLSKPIPRFFVFVSGATDVGKTLKYKVGKPDHLLKSVSFNKQVEFAALVQISLKDERTIVITATTNDDVTNAKVIADFRVELAKQFE